MKNRLGRFALGGMLAAGIALAFLERERFAPGEIEARVAQLGPWGPLVFIGVYLVAHLHSGEGASRSGKAPSGREGTDP